MKKHGFTLTEVIITVGIVGIIASMTIPSLVKNNRKEAEIATLQSTMQILEQAFTNMITIENVDSLTQTDGWENDVANSSTKEVKEAFFTTLGKYLSFSHYLNGTADVVDEYYGGDKKIYKLANDGKKGEAIDAPFSSGVPTFLKNGAVVFIQAFSDSEETSEDDANIKGITLRKVAATINIDVNGKNAPNTIGRDIFMFYLGDDGHLYPMGGKDAACYYDNCNNTWNAEDSNRACTDSKKEYNGLGCTARLVEEGFKMNY